MNVMPPTGESMDAIPRGMIIAFIIVFLAIIASGFFFYQSQEQQIKDQVTTDLTSISTLKANQIATWREDRLYDARIISAGTFFSNGADHYMSYGDDESRDNILSRFHEMNASLHYDNAMLVDPQGNVRLSLNPTITSINPSIKARVNASLKHGDAVLTDFYRVPGTQDIRMNLIAPLHAKIGDPNNSVGAVVLTINPDDFLYPLIMSWPVPSRSAETLLVEREGDHVLFLNELRHQPNTALNLTIPVSQSDVPAVKVILGTTGAFVGKDYRGVDVISVLEPVSGSPWFMVAKVDAEEAYTSWRSRSVLIIVMVAGTLVGAFIIIGLIWQRRQKSYYRSLYTAEAERREEEQRNRERLETLLRLYEMGSASEQELMDYVLDAGCRLTNSSLAFIGVMSPDESVFDITAWSKSAMKDCSVAASPIHFPIDKAGIWAEAVRKQKPLIVNDYTAPQTGNKGLPPGHVPITRFVSVPIFDGQRIVMVCAVANKETNYSDLDVDNLTLLMQGVWNHLRKRSLDEALRHRTSDLEAAYEEITASEEELKANYDQLAYSQRALAESEQKYRNLYQFAQVGLFETSFKDATIVACNQRYADLAGFESVEDAIGKDILHLYVNPEDRAEVGRVLREQGFIENHNLQLRNQSTGKIFWGQFSARYNFEREVAEGSIIDITAQKDAEAHLKESNEYLTSLFDYANAPIIVWDREFRITRFNHAFERLTGRTEQAVIGQHLEILFPESSRSASLELIRQTLTGERWEGVEIPIKNQSGEIRIVLWNSANIVDPKGTIIATIAQGQDITERKLADSQREAALEKLTESETRLSLTMEVGNAGMWEWNLDSNEVRFDEQFHAMLGYGPGELPSTLQEWLPYHNPEDIPVWMPKAEAYLRGDSPLYESEHRIRTKAGEWAWVFTRGRLVTPSNTKAPRWFIGFAMNITGRKKVEAELAAAQQQYRELFESVGIGIFRSTPGPEGAIIEANPAAVKIFDADNREQLLALRPSDLYPDHDERQRVSDEIVSRGGITGLEVRYKSLKGRLFWGRITAIKKIADDGFVYFDSTIEDITDRKQAEEGLKASEEKFSTAFKTSPYAITITRIKDGSFIEVNDAFTPITGFTHEEALSGSSVGFGLWVDAEDRKRVISTLLDGRTVNGEEFLFRRKNGELITGLFSASIISINNEPSILSSINDISDRMRAEEDLHKSELRFRTMTDWTYDWEYWINPERDALYVSPSVERITGYSPDEFAVDKGLMERIILPDDYALWEKHVSLHADADQHGNHAQIEFRIIRKDGTIRWIGHVCRSIYTEDGTWAGTRVSNRDITERKAAEDALRQSEEKYRVLFTRMIKGSALHEMVYNPSGNPVDYRIIDVNPAFESTLGIKREDIIGKTSREAYGVDAPPYFDIYARVATTGQPEWFEVYFEPMKKHFAISAYSTRKGRFATIFEDITDRKEAEELREHLIRELEQKNAELERFTYTVSHDLKSPLITIKGFAGLIEDDAQKGDPVQLKKDVNRITSAADTMQELLADVLELSRIGRFVSPPEKTSFSTIAHEAVELLAGPLAERGVTVSIAPDLPLVNVDHARIREVVVNLIENAVKFLGAQKEPVIRIGVEMQGITPVFFVQDNGIGIDPRYLERIFNLFERLDVSTHGTGIGLTIVRRIIEVHGGKIWAESEGAGKGTTFKFTLPGVTEGEVRP